MVTSRWFRTANVDESWLHHSGPSPRPGDIQARFDRFVPEFEARCSDQGRLDGDDPHLFLNAFGRGPTQRGFAKRVAPNAATAVRTVPSIAGKIVTTHGPRHAYALQMLEATGDIQQVAT